MIQPLHAKIIIVLLCTVSVVGMTSKALQSVGSLPTTPSAKTTGGSRLADMLGTAESSQTDDAIVQTGSTQAQYWDAALVSQHASAADCWTIIHEKIYNISQYIPFHPGGTENITAACGVDSTVAFDTKGGRGRPHLPSSQALLGSYFIANLGQVRVAASQDASGTPLVAQPVPNQAMPIATLPSVPLPTGLITLGNTNSTSGTNTTTGLSATSGSTGSNTSTQIVASHSTQSSCWLIINNGVYDVTQYIPYHPGGTQQILAYCGKEATQAFNSRGGTGSHSTSARNLLANYFIGNLSQVTASTQSSQGSSAGSSGTTTSTGTTSGGSGTTTGSNTGTGTAGGSGTTSTTTTGTSGSTTGGSSGTTTGQTATTQLTAAVVATHSTVSDCWLIVSNKVYSVAAYIPFHPGGTQRIVSYCGKESTTAFQTRGGSSSHSSNAWSLLANYYIGDLNTTVTTGSTGTGTSGSGTGTTTSGGGTGTGTSGGTSGGSGTGYSSPSAAVLAQYPGATITKVEYEDDGRSVVKFTYQGHKYEAKLNSSNVITKVEN